MSTSESIATDIRDFADAVKERTKAFEEGDADTINRLERELGNIYRRLRARGRARKYRYSPFLKTPTPTCAARLLSLFSTFNQTARCPYLKYSRRSHVVGALQPPARGSRSTYGNLESTKSRRCQGDHTFARRTIDAVSSSYERHEASRGAIGICRRSRLGAPTFSWMGATDAGPLSPSPYRTAPKTAPTRRRRKRRRSRSTGHAMPNLSGGTKLTGTANHQSNAADPQPSRSKKEPYPRHTLCI